jgi:cytochrome c peroxidase
MFRFCDHPGMDARRILVLMLRASAVVLGNLFAAAVDEQHGATAAMSRAEVYRQVGEASALGKRIFSDPLLSASGKMSCASCHDPRHAFAPANAMAVQRGGADLRQSGFRTVPSLQYLQAIPPFAEHFFDSDDEGDDSIDNGPTGGLTWDGRIDRRRDQARIPLLSPYEMANSDIAQVVAHLRQAAYADDFRRVFGAEIFSDSNEAFAALRTALED